MPHFSFAGLRARLLLLVLLAIIPAMGLILYTNVELRRTVVADVREDALRLARLAANDQEDSIRDARQLLFALAQLPQVRNSDPDACSAFFAQLLRQYPQYTFLGVVAPDGEIFCSAYPPSGPVNVADQSYFQRVLQTHDFAMSDYQVDQISGKAILNFGYPVLNEAGQIQAVIFASLDLTWLNQLATEAQLPAESTFSVIDRNGTILVRYPDPQIWVGRSVPEAPIIELILSQQGEGTAESPGVDGVPRLFAFTPLFGGLGGGDVYVNIGIPVSVAFADANRVLTRNLIGLGLVMALALIGAWLGGHWFILRWVNALVKATKRLSAGDLSARTGLSYSQGELSQLARAFDDMATSLERHIAERDQVETTLRETQRTLSTLLSNLPGMAYRCRNNRERTMEFVSEGCFELTGYPPAEMVAGMAYSDLIHSEDQETMWDKMQAALKENRPFQLTYRLIAVSGQEKWAWEQGRGVLSSQGKLLAVEGFITDATERVQTYQMLEQRVADRTRAISALYDVTAVASGSLNLETILNGSLSRVLAVMGVEAGGIHLMDEVTGALTLAAWQGVAEDDIVQNVIRPSDDGLTNRVLEQGCPLVSASIAAGLEPLSPTATDNAPPYVGAPMRAGGRVLGVLSAVGRAGQHFEEEEVALLDSIADQIAVAVENGRLYQQAEQLAVMEERSRLARELHDSVTQSLYSLTLYAEVGRRAAEAGEWKDALERLAQLSQVAQQTLKEMRLLVYELRTSALEAEGLVGALQQRLDAVEKRAGVEVHLLVEEMVELPPLVEEGLYRIAQEALNNILKHARATVVTVKVKADGEQAELEVIDDGRAFDPNRIANTGGMGLTSMHERAERVGGSLTISSEAGQGTRVRVTAPMQRSWSRPVMPIDKISEVSL
jgi:PAS domain S-box-containing protein